MRVAMCAMIRAATIRLVPLDASVPPWIAALPRHRLFDGPSPLGPLPRFSAAVGGGVEVWIKREDLLPLAFGGNKLRNLEFLVGAALAEGADTLVTVGRRWSNHARLTAAAGAQAGLEVHLVLSGPRDRPAEPGRASWTSCSGPWSTRPRPTTDASARRWSTRWSPSCARPGRRPYVIGVGRERRGRGGRAGARRDRGDRPGRGRRRRDRPDRAPDGHRRDPGRARRGDGHRGLGRRRSPA